MRAISAGAAIVLLASTVASGVSRAIQDNQAPVASGVNRAIQDNQAPVASGFSRKADAARGKMLYDKTLRCYACHGFDGQTGSPRLAPMPRSEESFITYLRKPATPGMPAFADVPRQDLVDVYAYITSLRADARPAASIPLLNDLIERATKR